MKYAILYNKMLMLPLKEANELFAEYHKDVGFKDLASQQMILDLLYQKLNVVERLKEEIIQEMAFAYAFMSLDKNPLADSAFETVKKYPMIVWIEALRFLDSNGIYNLLNNYHKEFTPTLIETFISNLDEFYQLKAIDKYIKEIDVNDKMFLSFYYAVSDKARKKLQGYFPDDLGEDILLRVKDMDEKEAMDFLLNNKEKVLEIDADSYMELILLKITKASNIEKIISNFEEMINECSTEKFELFFTRYRYLDRYKRYDDYDDFLDNQNRNGLTDLELFELFKNKFHQMGVYRTLLLFDNKEYYKINDFSITIIMNLLDVAYRDCDISDYVSETTFEELIKRFTSECREKDYSLKDFERLVKKAGCEEKFIFDDFIEAIIACGKLMKDKIIDDKNPLFIELREKFSSDLFDRVERDGTYDESISLNGIFYRLAKGSMPFEKVYMTKNFRGLVYLTKCGQLVDNADYITNFLTDEQLVKLNINPVLKWKNAINRKNTDADNLSFMERMGLQLLCYFGRDRGKYLLESEMQGNLMENLFDGLNYKDISINADGTANVNEELINFLFGYGKISEFNSIINKMIRGELPEFKKYFPEFCNEYFNIKEACNGVLSVKRIVRHFEDVELPINLKPDEIEFKSALIEMNTTSEDKLREAIGLCKDARDREYSTIPKVSGERGKFKYEILDLDNPLAVAVGNLSHCCFVVRGISYSALKHSMQSRNGRTFVVYYDDNFLTQSWVWRNGDVVCFDSVEAGSPIHGVYKDDIKLVDVYQEVAEKLIDISNKSEDEIQKVKLVTVGKSDYTFDDLVSFEGNVPRPLEGNVYVYDSSSQRILAGSIPKNIRYGEVGIQYYDERSKPILIEDISKTDLDKVDEAILNINALRYRNLGIEETVDFSEYSKIYSGDGWYILVDSNGNIEKAMIKKDRETEAEFNKYLKRIVDTSKKEIQLVKKNNFNNRG